MPVCGKSRKTGWRSERQSNKVVQSRGTSRKVVQSPGQNRRKVVQNRRKSVKIREISSWQDFQGARVFHGICQFVTTGKEKGRKKQET